MSKLTIVGLVVIALLAGCMSPSGETAAEKRQAVQNMRAETLDELYRIHPYQPVDEVGTGHKRPGLIL